MRARATHPTRTSPPRSAPQKQLPHKSTKMSKSVFLFFVSVTLQLFIYFPSCFSYKNSYVELLRPKWAVWGLQNSLQMKKLQGCRKEGVSSSCTAITAFGTTAVRTVSWWGRSGCTHPLCSVRAGPRHCSSVAHILPLSALLFFSFPCSSLAQVWREVLWVWMAVAQPFWTWSVRLLSP